MASAVQVECLIANSVNIARRKRRVMLRPEHGFTVGCVCGNDLCIEPQHLQVQRWKSFGGKFSELMGEISALGMDEAIELPDEKNTRLFRCNLGSVAYHTKFIVRSLPKGGVRIIRTGTWGGEITKKEYPVLVHKKAAPCNSLRAGCFWLGQFFGVSLARRDIPKYEHCKAKGCAFPANGNGQGLCRHHFHFFDYSVSRLGRNLDMEDIYGNDKQAPRFYVSWFWKHQSERLTFQQGGATSYWRDAVIKYQTLQTGAAAPVGMQRGISGLHHGQGPSKPNTKRSRRKMIGKGMGGHYAKGNHPAQKPEKRWSRTQLEAQADRILAASGFFEEFSAASAATCARKIRYEDRPAAKRALRHVNANNRGGDTLEVYSCRDCSGWHLGNRWAPDASVRSDPRGYILKEPEIDEEQERESAIDAIDNREFESAWAGE